MRKKYFYAAALATMLASCSELSELQPEVVQPHAKAVAGETPVAFSAYTSRSITRGGVIGELTTASLKGDAINGGFGVFGYYTDASDYLGTTQPNFMYNQQVVWQESQNAWTYTPVVYWPNEYGSDAQSIDEDKVTFFAYAPYIADTNPAKGTVANPTWGITGLTKNTSTGDPIVKFLGSFNLGEQVDLCWATANSAADVEWQTIQGDGQTISAGMPWIDVQHPAAINQPMKFYFNHALASLNVQIDLDADVLTHKDDAAAANGTKVYVRSITFSGMTMKGALNLNNSSTGAGKPNWVGYSGQGALDFSDIVLNDGRKDGKEGQTSNPNEANSNALNNIIISNNNNTTAGVTAEPVNLFRGGSTVDDAIYVIPSNGEPLKVTIVYDVETSDPNLSSYLSDGVNKGSSIENKITKEIEFDGEGLVSGHKHILKLHLGLNSVKFDAEVTPWAESGEYNPWLPGQTVDGVGINNPANPLTLVSGNNGAVTLNKTGSEATTYTFNGTGEDKTLVVSATKNNSYTITNNGVALITANVAGTRGTRAGEAWSTSVTDAMGVKIKPMKKGQATLTATDNDGNKSTIVITVDASEIKLDANSLTLYKFAAPTDIDNGTITASIEQASYEGAETDTWADPAYSVSVADIVDISESDGVFTFTPMKVGSTVVTFTTSQGQTATATITVKVPSLKLDKTTVYLKGGSGATQEKLTITAVPAFSETMIPKITATGGPENYTYEISGKVITLTGANIAENYRDGKIKVQYTGHEVEANPEDPSAPYDPSATANVQVSVVDPGLALSSEDIQVGMIIGSNGKAYTTSDEARLWKHQAVAIVAYKGDGDTTDDTYNHGLALALSCATYNGSEVFQFDSRPISTITETCGDLITAKAELSTTLNGIQRTEELYTEEGHVHPGIVAVKNYYVKAPQGTSGWFMPSAGQLNLVYMNLWNAIVPSTYYVTNDFTTTGGNQWYGKTSLMKWVSDATCPEFSVGTSWNQGYKMSTTEAGNGTFWGLSLYYGILSTPGKNANASVQPILAF